MLFVAFILPDLFIYSHILYNCTSGFLAAAQKNIYLNDIRYFALASIEPVCTL